MRIALAALCFALASCATAPPPTTEPYTVVLGIAQDGGYPQAGCEREDCIAAWRDPSRRHRVASLGIVDPLTNERWLIDATPDFPWQLHSLGTRVPTGILLTHAHIGHYLGLAHLGREVMGARNVPVYAMPRMREFLERNGPWSQLVSLSNISLITLHENEEIALNARIRVTARLTGSPLLAKVRFIHLNQSNPLLRGRREGVRVVVGREGERLRL